VDLDEVWPYIEHFSSRSQEDARSARHFDLAALSAKATAHDLE
jgi:hypothetical protein